MRSDMKYVVIEAPRHGGHSSRIRRPRRVGEDFQNLPKQEGMRMRHTDRKGLSDFLSPLYGYLRKQVGRRWDDVHSEMSQHLDRSSVQGFHVWSHVYDSRGIQVDVRMINGKPYYIPDYYPPGWQPVDGLYVDPETGIICETPPKPRYRYRGDKDAWKTVKVSDTIQLQWIDGQWYEITFGVAPRTETKRIAHYDGTEEIVVVHKKGEVIQLSKKQLSKKERKRYGLDGSRPQRGAAPDDRGRALRPVRRP